MSETLADRITRSADRAVHPAITQFAERLAHEAGAAAVLFYGSNLRTGSLDGVLDFYVLMPADAGESVPAKTRADRIWPRIGYRECSHDAQILRAKTATMPIDTFARAAAGRSRDTTIWTRFVQPSALVWSRDEAARDAVLAALADAAKTASRLAATLGPASGTADAYWRALFQATYKAEFRVEKRGREDSILSVNADHFDGLLPLAWSAQGLVFERAGNTLRPRLSEKEQRRAMRWWRRRRRLGKPLNLMRLMKASTTFDGAARYAAWKVERHTGIAMEVTPAREKRPLLAAPEVLYRLWRHRRKRH
ncbi:hypothetical protein HME9302_02450 [Alteripontixanthobacter maritimus]|uniref:Uncharacterized protein n=1 Tax=Alteripontixanthobacter maritimus TaxID=2161824 RepID=A0A369QA52_9SPHN|nr:hypothetical protein [Alteripontixanthobacter maritimus]RDC61230.1 hypothetical protein HME9302_02450 [Alteripontixanthobacter maritimus]